jgi:20S proteasome alpha/beta subunit
MELLSVLGRSSAQNCDLSWEQKQYLKRMTLQVCLIGQDGFVLASDTRGARLGPGEITQHYSTSKIYLNERECAAWCSSGHDLGKRLCERLSELYADSTSDSERTLTQLMHSVRDAASEIQLSAFEREMQLGTGRLLLVARREDEIKGFIFELGWGTNPQRWGTVSGDCFEDRMCSGATGNAAIYFPERHYSRDSGESELIRVAAHTVLMGHELDPGPIAGLEVVVCRSRRLRRLAQFELEGLRSFSVAQDRLLSKQFREAPNVIG